MCEQLDKELENGRRAALRIVEHLDGMCAARLDRIVEVNGTEYVVSVTSKNLHRSDCAVNATPQFSQCDCGCPDVAEDEEGMAGVHNGQGTGLDENGNMLPPETSAPKHPDGIFDDMESGRRELWENGAVVRWTIPRYIRQGTLQGDWAKVWGTFKAKGSK